MRSSPIFIHTTVATITAAATSVESVPIRTATRRCTSNIHPNWQCVCAHMCECSRVRRKRAKGRVVEVVVVVLVEGGRARRELVSEVRRNMVVGVQRGLVV